VEIFLNFVWAVLAFTLVVLWLRIGCRLDQNRRSQIIAIAILIAVLFPVISVSDDLMTAQNPAETDNCQRRDHLAHGSAHLLQMAAVVPPSICTRAPFGILQYVLPGKPLLRVVARPALTSIANRPPPVA
jgi:hypothetical protein